MINGGNLLFACSSVNGYTPCISINGNAEDMSHTAFKLLMSQPRYPVGRLDDTLLQENKDLESDKAGSDLYFKCSVVSRMFLIFVLINCFSCSFHSLIRIIMASDLL